ncbi:YitT family protein [Aureimonas psammosilenae]|uniref:YitT family protein n=1 Tax=Aureimonas psammosilenae TaxID=2495496 RepID=UPI0012604143|nr:YitT family protein [Aureimonas psammosilenae]
MQADSDRLEAETTAKAHRFGHWAATPTRHSPWEDALGILAGVALTAVGIAILNSLGFLTSGMAGFAFVIHYLTGWNFGLVFFVLNLPFYLLAIGRMGRAFTVKTACAVLCLSVFTAVSPSLLSFAYVQPLTGAVLGGLMIGFGLLALFRHRSSVGGVGIVAVYCQDRFGWRAGLTQLGVDILVFLSAFAAVSPRAVLYSLLGALVLNLFLAINHRTDRYLAT